MQPRRLSISVPLRPTRQHLLVQALGLQAEGLHPRLNELREGVAVGLDSQEGQLALLG